MTNSEATLDEFGPEEELTWSQTLAGIVKVALVVAAVVGAVALVAGRFGGFDGADLISVLGGVS